jgi:hypothetical protein
VQLNPGFVFTFPLDFDGKKTRKQLSMINVHVSSDTGGVWGIWVYPNQGPGKYVQAAPYEDPLYSVYNTPLSFPVDSPNEKDLVALTAKFSTDGASLVAYRFMCYVYCSVMAAPTELYAIDVGYTDWEEPGDGDP